MAQQQPSPILRLETGGHTSNIVGLAVSADGKLIATASYDQTVRFWSMPGLEPLRTVRMPLGSGFQGAVTSAAFAPNGKTLATAGRIGSWDGDHGPWCIYLLDVNAGDIERTICDLPAIANRLAYSADSKYLAVTLKGGKGLRVYRIADASLAFEDTDYSDSANAVEFDTTGRLITTSLDGKVRLYDKDFHLTASRRMPEDRKPLSASFSPDGTKIAVGYAEPEGDDPRWSPAVDVLSASDLSILFRPDLRGVDNGALWRVAWSADATSLYATGTWRRGNRNPIRRWADGGRGRPKDVGAALQPAHDMRRVPGGGIAFVSEFPYLGVIGSDDRLTAERKMPIADYSEIGEHLAVSQDGMLVQFAFEASGERPAHFSFVQRSLDSGEVPNSAQMARPITDAPDLDVRDWSLSYRPTLSGKPLPIEPHDTANALAFAPNAQSFVLGTGWYLYHYNREGELLWRTAVLGYVRGVVISGDGRLAVAALGDGTLRWYAMESGKELVALFPHPDGSRWVAWTPSGYYMTSVGGDAFIGWQVNRGRGQAGDFFSIARFRDLFYRPDVIEKIFGTLDEGRALRRGELEPRQNRKLDVGALLPPVLSIVTPADATVVSSPKITLEYAIRRVSAEPIKALQVRARGQLIAGIEEPGGSIAEHGRIELYIPREDTVLQITAETGSGIWSEPAAVHLRWGGSVEDLKPSLFILAIGIAKYQSPELRLNWAAKDAEDFRAIFEQQNGLAYRNVEVLIRTDEHANRAEVKRALQWFASAPTRRDIAVLFMAGHGIDDQIGRYFFVPQDISGKDVRDLGISYQEIRTALASAAGRVLFFIDTCHSGAASGAEEGLGADVVRIANDLKSPEHGIATFASSTIAQNSYERADWGNGAFTKALIEGLSGRADLFGNGYVTATGLGAYVSDRVPKLTNGKQTPAIGQPVSADLTLVRLR